MCVGLFWASFNNTNSDRSILETFWFTFNTNLILVCVCFLSLVHTQISKPKWASNVFIDNDNSMYLSLNSKLEIIDDLVLQVILNILPSLNY